MSHRDLEVVIKLNLLLKEMKLTVLLTCLFSCLCLVQVEHSLAQCGVATVLPSDVDPSIEDEYFTSQLATQITELENIVTRTLRAYHIDVYAITVVYRNSTIFSTGLVDTPFRIGSVTKAFTALGPLLLQKHGADLHLDDPVTKFLPTFSVAEPADSGHGITLRELMGHASGLPHNLCAGLICEPELSEEESLALVAKMQLARPRWSALPVYSNLGFAVLGHAWEKATSPRRTWSAFLRDELWAPLGMDRTGVPADLGEAELAPGNVRPFPANYSIGWQAPCGDMYSTAHDLAKFLKFLLHPTALLFAESLRETTHPATVFPATSSGLRGFALPWELIGITPRGANRSTTLITKNGQLGSYGSVIAFHPDTHLGVAVLTSTDTPSLQIYELLGLQILQVLIPAVQSLHARFIASLYSGVYVCEHTAPVVSAHIRSTTLQVLGGSVSVTTATLDQNLVANYNLNLVQNGVRVSLVGSRSLVRKMGSARHAFWSSPGDCFALASYLGSGPEIARPNFPESVDLYEFEFEVEAALLRWPALGGMCHKS